jgi:hypothetical protein
MKFPPFFIACIASICLGTTTSMARADTYQKLVSNKWSIGSLPCDLHGGAFMEYGPRYKTGERMTSAGLAIETDQRAWHKFTKVDQRRVKREWAIFAEGNRMMENLTGSKNAVVGKGVTVYEIEGETLFKESVITQLDPLSRPMRYKTKAVNSIAERCKS